MDAFINPIYLGDTGNSGVSRLNLADSGLASILSITIEDDNVISGGTGAASGYDLDLIKISPTLVTNPSQVAALPSLSAFIFADTNVLFQAGFLRPWQLGDDSDWNLDRLFGTNGGSSINFSAATFSTLDGEFSAGGGGLSLGEGGRISFTLNSAIAPTGLYLYVADAGGGNDNFRVKVSTEVGTLQPGVTLVGTDSDDVIDLSQGTNEPVGRGNDVINGGLGADTIFSGAGDDQVNGDEDSDILNGGLGNDSCNGFDGDDLLNGGEGSDILTGGGGFDRFIFDIGVRFNKSTIGVDTITDFARGDLLVLDRSTFKRVKGSQLAGDDFAVVRNVRLAKQSDALFTYIRKSGALYYNENRDQSGFGQGSRFVDLTNGLNLGLRDLTIVV